MGLEFLAGEAVDGHSAILPDDTVDRVLDAESRLPREAWDVQIDSAGFGAQMETDSVGVEHFDESRRQQMLSCVLLYMIETPGPVDDAGHRVCVR